MLWLLYCLFCLFPQLPIVPVIGEEEKIFRGNRICNSSLKKEKIWLLILYCSFVLFWFVCLFVFPQLYICTCNWEEKIFRGNRVFNSSLKKKVATVSQAANIDNNNNNVFHKAPKQQNHELLVLYKAVHYQV